jgi:DNA-binding SARP family transcriptional activator
MIFLHALGTAEIRTGLVTVTPSQKIVFAAALYLVIERGKRVSRNLLSSLLWPSVSETKRAHRLRQTILQLKKLGLPMRADRDTIELAKDDARTDLDGRFPGDLTHVDHSQSFEFLPGYNPYFSESFRDWVEAKRSEVHSTSTRILVHELEKARRQADWLRVEKIAAKCLSLDAFNEVAILSHAEATAMRGGKHKAVSILDRYISDVGDKSADLKVPAVVLRKRVVERIPDRPTLANADPPFVGREIEMEHLTRKLEEARIGRGSATLLLGEPGIGKSRICAELGRFAELQGAQVQRTQCRRPDLDRPLSIFVDIVPQLRELPGALGCEPETFSFLKRLTEFQQRTGASSPIVDSEVLFQSVRSALFDLIGCIADERRFVMIIEDVQWLDDASCKILTQMVEWSKSKRLFFLLNARPGEDSILLRTDMCRLDTIVVGRLKTAASTVLLQAVAMSPGKRPEPDFIEWCLTVAEGNPFFLQELAHQWIETGRRYEAPPSVTKVLQERLSRLSREGLQVLQTCAILGDHATLDRVERVLEYHAYQLLSAVEELSNAAMLNLPIEHAETPSVRLQPRHDCLSSAAVNRLPPLALAFIHRRSADVLEQEIPQEAMPTTLLWACATHRHHAGDREEALKLSISCAEHLLEVGLAGDASNAFQKSLDYCVTDEERLQVLPRAAFASQLNGDWERTKSVLSLCMRLATRGDPSSGSHNEFELQLLAARHQSTLDFSALLEDVKPCVCSPDASASHRVKAAVFALKIATDIGPPAVLESIYGHVSHMLHNTEISETARLEVNIIYRTTRGNEVVPIRDLQLFVESARATGGELAYSNALLTAAAACRISGRFEEGLAFVAKAFEHAASNKRPARFSRILVCEIRLHITAGAFDKAESTLNRLIQCPIPSDDAFAQSEVKIYQARIALNKGDVRAASVALGDDQIFSRRLSPRRQAHAIALRLHIGLQEKIGEDEIRSLVSALELEHFKVRGLGGQDFEAYAFYLGLRYIGEPARALATLREYVGTIRRSMLALPMEIQEVMERGRGSVGRCPDELTFPDGRAHRVGMAVLQS